MKNIKANSVLFVYFIIVLIFISLFFHELGYERGYHSATIDAISAIDSVINSDCR